MILDLHCHSRYSYDNHLEPEDLIHRASELGLNGVCFTEHNSVDASGHVHRMQHPPSFVVLRGVEVSTDMGHLLVYGLLDDSWNKWGRTMHLQLHKVVDSVHSLGGICVPAHPFRGWESLGEALFAFNGFDAVETHNGVNGSEQNQPAIKAALKLGLPSIGGSDCHYLHQVGRAFTQFDNPIATVEDLVREIRAGACRGRLL
jgi:predicted metal-dependent phosphoesterase TrpH